MSSETAPFGGLPEVITVGGLKDLLANFQILSHDYYALFRMFEDEDRMRHFNEAQGKDVIEGWQVCQYLRKLLFR